MNSVFKKVLFVIFSLLNLWDMFVVSIYFFMCVRSQQIDIIFIQDVQLKCFGQ